MPGMYDTSASETASGNHDAADHPLVGRTLFGGDYCFRRIRMDTFDSSLFGKDHPLHSNDAIGRNLFQFEVRFFFGHVSKGKAFGHREER